MERKSAHNWALRATSMFWAIFPIASLALLQGSARTTQELEPSASIGENASLSCPGGMPGAVDVQVDLVAVNSDMLGRQSLELSVAVDNAYETTAGVQVAYVFVNSEGGLIEAPTTPAGLTIGARASDAVFAETPTLAEDGRFAMRIVAAATDGDDETVLETERYFEVSGGDILPITSEEWFASVHIGTHENTEAEEGNQQ